MKFTIVALATAATVGAQLTFESDGTFKCLGDAAGKNFCAGDSLQTNIIIRCTGETGQPGNCNDNLAGVPPVGVKSFAPCYQTSNTTGDAACSFNGIAYPDSGNSFPIPGASSSSTSAAPTYGATSSSAPVYTSSAPVYTVSSAPVYTVSSAPVYTVSSAPVYTVSSAPIYSNSTLTTVSSVVVPTTSSGPIYTPPPTSNGTSSFTSSLPTPTQSPSSAGALFVRESIVLGAVALAGFLLL